MTGLPPFPAHPFVPPPPPPEESRLLAEALADVHRAMSLIADKGLYLLPGESVDEFRAAWFQSQESMARLINSLSGARKDGVPYGQLAEHGLTGEEGKLKRSTLRRFFDAFMSHITEPFTKEKQLKVMEAGSDLSGTAATIVGSIPGHEKLVELFSLAGQLMGIRARRGA